MKQSTRAVEFSQAYAQARKALEVTFAAFVGYLCTERQTARASQGHRQTRRGNAMSTEKVWEAWKLCDACREYAQQVGREVPVQEVIDKIFMPSSLVDVERTEREGGNPPTKIFLKSPYGIEYRSETKNWIPFRHGEIKL
jgi:hypothetical protein